MNKRCTNSSCRKTFSTLTYGGTCPFCGKEYPQLTRSERSGHKMIIRIDGKRIKFMLSEIEWYRLKGQRVKGIKAVRREFKRHGYAVPLMAAKKFYESHDGRQYRMSSWRVIPDPATGERRIEPVNGGERKGD